METKRITFIVTAAVSFDNENGWLKGVREVRKVIKENIMRRPGFQVLKIDSKVD